MERISFEWQFQPVGEVSTHDTKLAFPKVISGPGIYRFTLSDAKGSQHYIGETELLPRRFQHYRTPEPTQTTNIRINGELRRVLANGGYVTVDIISEAWIVILSGERTPIDLSWKTARVMVEGGVLLAARQAGHRLLNL